MAGNRKSFLLHIDSLDILDELTDEEAGMLFKAIRNYQRCEELNIEGLVRIAFSPFRNQFNRDSEKYEKLCEKNRLIAVNRHRTKSTTGTNGTSSSPVVTKSTDNDNDSDSKNDNDSDSKNDSKNKPVPLSLNYDSWESKPSEEVLKEWLSNRKKKKLSVSQLVITKTGKEINAALKFGYSADDCLGEAIVRGWQGVKADWMQNSGAKKTALHDVSNKTYYEGDL